MPEEQRFVLGIAYQAGPDPRITKGADGGRDYFTKEELEKACWSYMRNGPRMNAFHVEGTEDCAEPVESFIWRWDDWDAGDGIVVKDGDWLLGSILSPRMWDAKKAGRVNGYSPEGTARRRRVAKEGVVTVAKGAAGLDGEDDELTPLSDASMTKVALVGAGANGIPRFLISKEADATGLLDPEFVRELIGKQAEPEPPAEPDGQVTMTGSPAAIAKLMQEGALRFARPVAPDGVAKAKVSTADKNDHPDSDFAYIESGGHKDESGKTAPRSKRHFLIHDAAHVRNALARIGQGAAFGEEALPKVKAAARKFGIDVAKEMAMPETVTKDMGPELDDGTDGLDPTVPLAAPEDDAPGDPADPGSPAWESIDAATAQKWTSIAVRLKNALRVLAEREMLEAASADPGDCENAFDLQDAMCAVDYVIDTLAGFAVDEQAGADLGGEAMEAIGKAMADEALPGALTTVETFGAIVRKSGRVLSAVNETHIREAAQRLNTVLSSLPSAPAADDGQQVAKTANEEADMPQPAPSAEATAASGQEPAMGTAEPAPVAKAAGGQDDPREAAEAAPVRKSALALVYDRDGNLAGVTEQAAIVRQVAKADGEKKPMQAVFDQDGDLIGIVDPDAIQPVTGAGGKPAPEDGAPEAPAADDGGMTPAPPAETGTPADAVADDGTVAKSSDQDVYAALESAVTKAVAAALDSRTPAGDIAKQADVAGLLEEVETLKARLETVENSPAAPKVFTNGQVPPAHQLRGQDQGASPVIDVAKAREMKQRMYTADPAEANRIATEMNRSAIATLEAIHSGARQ